MCCFHVEYQEKRKYRSGLLRQVGFFRQVLDIFMKNSTAA